MAIVVAEKIVMRRTADLIPYANNSRTHSDKQVVQIASIREFGFTTWEWCRLLNWASVGRVCRTARNDFSSSPLGRSAAPTGSGGG
jgi:hypothetical protein